MLKFKQFVNELNTSLLLPLPEKKAQFLMAPENREDFQYQIFSPIASSVLLLLFPLNEEIATVFIKRPLYNGIHGGQIAFPGGKFDTSDNSLFETALREAQEELGLNIDDVKIIGHLSNLYIPPSNYEVFPVIAFSEQTPQFFPDTYEVESYHMVTLKDLFSPENNKIVEFEVRGIQVKAPCYFTNGIQIWGATAMILSELHEVFKQNNLKFY